jgi:hypothetical protein
MSARRLLGVALVTVVAIGCEREHAPAVAGPPAPSASPSAPPTEVAPPEPAPNPEPTADPVVTPLAPEPEPPPTVAEVAVPRGGGERLNPAVAGVGTEALLAALPERVAGWTRTRVFDSPAGKAGSWADSAHATYQRGATEIRVDLTDMIRVQACEPGMGAHLIAESIAGDAKTKAVKLGTHAAAVAPDPPGFTLGAWLGDRCQVDLDGDDATAKQLVELGAGLGLDALATACARRDAVGPLGL